MYSILVYRIDVQDQINEQCERKIDKGRISFLFRGNLHAGRIFFLKINKRVCTSIRYTRVPMF